MLAQFSLWHHKGSKVAINPDCVSTICSSINYSPPATIIIMDDGKEYQVLGSYDEVLEKINGADNSRNEQRDNGSSQSSGIGG